MASLIEASAISKADLRKTHLLASQTPLNEEQTPEFQILVANGHLETPNATVELQFEIGDIQFKRYVVVTNLTSPLFELLFLQRNSTILDIRQRVFIFLFFSIQLKHLKTRTLTLTNFHQIQQTVQPGK